MTNKELCKGESGGISLNKHHSLIKQKQSIMPTEQGGFAQPANVPAGFNPNQEKQKPLSFGQKLVGLTFNPSGDERVNKAKQLCADLADLLHDEMYAGGGEQTELQSRLYNHTIGEILNAQMNTVKLLTLKY